MIMENFGILISLDKKAYDYGKNSSFAKGWVRKLLKTDIWAKAEDILYDNFNGICNYEYCWNWKKFKYIFRENAVIHHEFYDWKHLFSNGAVIVHRRCHAIIHNKILY